MRSYHHRFVCMQPYHYKYMNLSKLGNPCQVAHATKAPSLGSSMTFDTQLRTACDCLKCRVCSQPQKLPCFLTYAPTFWPTHLLSGLPAWFLACTIESGLRLWLLSLRFCSRLPEMSGLRATPPNCPLRQRHTTTYLPDGISGRKRLFWCRINWPYHILEFPAIPTAASMIS
jgi:hypothetical protein